MDTNKTVDEHIEWIRQYATNARVMADLVISWKFDLWRVEVGLAEFVDWPEVPEPGRRLRNSEPRGSERGERPEGTRLVHHNGFMYLVRDL